MLGGRPPTDMEDGAPPLGVAGTRTAPKSCGFTKICVNPLLGISAEARGQESREVPRFLPSYCFLSSALVGRKLGMEHTPDPAEPHLNLI